MPEQVASTVLLDAGGSHVVTDHLCQPVRTQRSSLSGHKERVIRMMIDRQHRPNFFEVASDPGNSASADRNDAILFVFAQSYEQETSFGIEVLRRQANQLQSPHSGRIEGFQDGSISQPA